MNKISLCLLLVAMCLGWTARAAEQPSHAGHGASPLADQEREKKWKDNLAKPSFAVTTSFDENGRLWLASIRGQHVWVSYSDDRGVTQSAPVKVNAEPEAILGDGENRPKIIVRKGVVYVSYTQGLAKPMTGDIRFSRSNDGGKSFSAPVTVNDKREQSAEAAKGEKYNGSAIYYAMSDDGGVSFRPNVKIADHVCECCRTAMAIDTDDYPVVTWRHIYDTNIRDHALVKLDGKMAPVRLSHENWNVAACPHHGRSEERRVGKEC